MIYANKDSYDVKGNSIDVLTELACIIDILANDKEYDKDIIQDCVNVGLYQLYRKENKKDGDKI